ncbi:pyruvate carboxylase [Desulfohalobium retbaense]|uniref:pyruvate carboxylase n=1 Tax=Desulfohalobium retbaense (strain ATCC 49708 / DSM 5692 / JCM 16813 / HR100) TaxID=485915 RepID=C8X595_DESRD|nr:pyruvate carboxylase [Desulfohalobium retbaense]ACV69592.1 Carbamoyl-phosphate synthase L chain ATP- binding protein [Desulfohalobium retbaense DSM 5692]
MQEKAFESVVEELRDQPILVANRGIPARRIARSILEVFQAVPIITATEEDKTAPFTTGAQELLLLGSNPQAYLDIDLIINRAKARGVKAIHPGWGFASEDEAFPEKCRAAGLVFIGPPSRPMHILGNKVQVRNLAKEHGVPVVPGSDGAVSIDEARRIAEDIDFPIMLKAEGGGGGRGIYEVYQQSELERAFAKASSLAQASFGNPRLYVEKLLTSIRHIEIQVIADQHGNVFAFDERDCTVQRNHQKLVEITPSPWPVMTEELRERLKEYSRRLVSAVGYHSLATVEFLVDMEGNPYLIEVNTRLQVEHGITECRYGIDLVEEQIAVAFGAKLRLDDAKPCPGNHALQVRINCEDPQDGFAPNAGRITRYLSPGGQGVRVDSCLAAGYEFPSQYDSAASLLIAYGRDWSKVLGVMERALGEYVISGVKTTISFHQRIIANPQFRSGDYDTTFVGKTPQLLEYVSKEAEAQRLGRLVCEISAYGHNPFVQLGEYRGRSDKRLGALDVVQPEVDFDAIESPYPRGDRQALLDYVRDTEHVHFTDTTTRDITQSNSGNRFRLAEDRLIGPYLDNCGFFSLENGGGAHFHVAMLANMTYPFTEAREWNEFAPKTPKQILIRSTNVLGYKPQPKNLMQRTGEMICEHYDIIRCFDFLNHIENMRPFAEVVANSRGNVFEPALSITWAKEFDVDHYMQVTESVVRLMADVTGTNTYQASRLFCLGLKDMAGACPPRFIRRLVESIRKKYPDLVLHYHRHYTDGLFVPALGAAVEAGAHIVDTGIGSTVRWYGQGDVLATAAYIEGEIGVDNNLNKDMIRKANFVAKQIMPYYDRYTAPHFQGIDHDVVYHGMPGGATSSSQEGAMKQGYIHLLPYMLRFLAGSRKIVHYHDVTPGSQITWNTAFLAVTGAYKREGEKGVQRLLRILETVVSTPEDSLSEALRTARLEIYQDSNDAFRQLLLGRYGKLPLGFPPDWVYESAFGEEFRKFLEKRTSYSPLPYLQDINIENEKKALQKEIGREASSEEVVMYCNHPGDALKTIDFINKYGDPNQLPLHVWFEGLQANEEIYFKDRHGKPHHLFMKDITGPDESGISTVRYTLDSESFTHSVQVAEPSGGGITEVEMADPKDPCQVAAPSTGDLWVMHVQPGDQVNKGDEIFNISIMKQEKAVLAQVNGMVERVVKAANYMEDKKMVPVKEGELLVVIGKGKINCVECGETFPNQDCIFCPWCGKKNI